MKEYIQYIALFGGLGLSLILGPILIPILRRLKFGQTVRDDGPQTHIQKTGTPTIGGLIFLIPILSIGCIIAVFYPEVWMIVIATAAFGLVGFVDDWIKVVRKSKDGFKIKQKTFVILAFSIAYSIYIGWYTNIGIEIDIPFLGVLNLGSFTGVFFVLFVITFLYGTTNTVNFADGLDGLLSGLMIIVMTTLAVISLWKGEWTAVNYFSVLVVSSLVGFLAFNIHPAKVFMGDTGSLALGGMLASTLLVMKMPFMIFIFGLIFVIEGISVAVQVFWFKVFGRRIFKMAPIHHHFEILGWSETKVVKIFWAFCAITCIIGGLIIL